MADDRPEGNSREARLERRRRSVYLLPNLFTAASLFSAMGSVLATANGEFQKACYLILLSAVFDALDGPIARITRSASSFGLQFDSLADVVAFGVAPAWLMLSKLRKIGDSVELSNLAPNLALGACSIYVVCGAIRLARFNIQVSKEERKYFTGLPIPGAAGVVVSSFLFIETYLRESRNLHFLILVLMVCLAVLMVSTIPFPKVFSLLKAKQGSASVLIALVFLAALVLIFWSHLPVLLATGFILYVALSVLNWMRKRPVPTGNGA